MRAGYCWTAAKRQQRFRCLRLLDTRVFCPGLPQSDGLLAGRIRKQSTPLLSAAGEVAGIFLDVDMNPSISRGHLLKSAVTGANLAAFASAASALQSFARMDVGTARVDVTPDKPRICASGDKPDPPVAYARLISRCMTLFDGRRRMAIVNYPFNCLT
jgi:hypothetical protein